MSGQVWAGWPSVSVGGGGVHGLAIVSAWRWRGPGVGVVDLGQISFAARFGRLSIG